MRQSLCGAERERESVASSICVFVGERKSSYSIACVSMCVCEREGGRERARI